VLSMITDYNHGFWIGTENDGLNFFNKKTETFTLYKKNATKEKSLNHDSIWSIYIDRKENLWVGTFAGGINFHSNVNQPFQHYKHYPGNTNSLSDNSVSVFHGASAGKVWIGTDGGGLNLFDPDKDLFKTYNMQNSKLSNNAVLSLCEDRQGNLWVGTWAGGLNLYDRRKKQFKQFTTESHGLGSNNVYDILEDQQGRLWIATYWGGVGFFNLQRQRFTNYSTTNSALPDNQTRVITEDSFGNIWVGGESGLVRIDYETQNFQVYLHDENDAQTLSNNVINTIFEASDSTLWIGTTYGLNRFNAEGGTFIQYDVEDGLPNNYIQAVTEDELGNLWISTNKGISRYNRDTRIFKNFVMSDGLQGNEFYRNSVFNSRDNQLYFGGHNGFNIIDPKTVLENPNIPQIIITDFRIFNRPVAIGAEDSPLKQHISLTENFTLSYKHSVFSFEFTALNYSSPEKNQYAYILEGFDEEWNYVGTKRTATYTNIAPGEYVFRVRGSNNDNKWNLDGAAISIKIEPPFWKTWWAYLSYFVLIVGAIYSVMHYMIARERLKSALEMEHLELEKMHELDQVKSRFFANISHEFRTPITLILGPLERLISNNPGTGITQKPLQLIYRNAQRLLRMSNQLMDFHKIEAEELKLELSKADIIEFISGIVESFSDQAFHHNINLQFKSNVTNKKCWFDIDKIDKIIYNLLSNAFKFTKDNGEIIVHALIKTANTNGDNDVDLGAQYIQMTIEDNGAGIAPDKIAHIFERFYQANGSVTAQYQGTGIGLALTYELVKLYHGQITVESNEGKGSKFTIRLPLDKYFLDAHQLVGDVSSKEHQNQANNLTNYSNGHTHSTAELTGKKADFINLNKAKSQTVLIVEDDEEMATYLKDAFQSEYRTLVSANGLEGFEKAIEIIPDIIISDIMMPEMDGIQLCETLKTNEKTSHIPVILLTARASDVHQIKGIQTGADAYITKPFNLDVLTARVTNLLDSRRKLRERFSNDVTLNPRNVAMTHVDEQFLQKIIAVVEENMTEPDFNAEMLSKKVAMSRMQLYRKLRSLTDQTVHEFIRNLRLKKALEMLEKRRLTVTEVAYAVGFNDLTYFARCFRKRFGKLPSEFRTKQV